MVVPERKKYSISYPYQSAERKPLTAPDDFKKDNKSRNERKLIRKKNTLNPILKWLLVVSSVVFLLIMYVSQYAIFTNLNHEYNMLNAKINQIENQNQRLELQIAGLTSIKRIENTARNDLKMIEPNEVIEVYVSDYGLNKTDQSAADEEFFYSSVYNVFSEYASRVSNFIASFRHLYYDHVEIELTGL